jgi:hypothetical protein
MGPGPKRFLRAILILLLARHHRPQRMTRIRMMEMESFI